MIDTVHTFPVLADPPGLIEARAAPSPETLAKVKEVAQSLLAAYDRETFMRSADCHPDTCECSRCGFDRLRAALDKETDR